VLCGALLLANAPAQPRAVGPTGATLVVIRIVVQALNRNDFLSSRACQLQRVLGGWSRRRRTETLLNAPKLRWMARRTTPTVRADTRRRQVRSGIEPWRPWRRNRNLGPLLPHQEVWSAAHDTWRAVGWANGPRQRCQDHWVLALSPGWRTC